jgi:DNA-damage-inducible protein J
MEVFFMSTANINIRTDQETKAAAQKIFATLGLDMTTAINLFLRQTVRANDIPFVLTMNPEKANEVLDPNNPNAVRPPFKFGSMAGKIWMADDFDAPLEDFAEYM